MTLQAGGIFMIQEDVAKAIAAALQVPLGLKQGDASSPTATSIPQSYLEYLRAEALFRSRIGGVPFTATIALLEQVVARQPNYAPAWALLAQAYSNAPTYDPDYYKSSVEQLRRLVDADLPKGRSSSASGN